MRNDSEHISENSKASQRRAALAGGQRHRPKLTVSRKLWLGFGVLLLLLIGGGVVIERSIRTIDANLKEITESEEPKRAAALEMEINVIGTGFAVLRYLDDRDPAQLARIEDDAADFAHFQQQYHDLTLGANNEADLNLSARVDEVYREFTPLARELIALEDLQVEKTGLFLQNMDQLDVILDGQIKASLDRSDLASTMKLHAAHEMEISASGVAKDLGDYLRTHDTLYAQRAQEGEADFERSLAMYESLGLSSQERQWADDLRSLFADCVVLAQEIIDLDKAKELGVANFVQLRDDLDLLFHDEILPLALTEVVEAKAEAERSVSFAQWALLGLLIASLGGGGAAIIIGRGISKPLRKLAIGVDHVSRGDLSHVIDVDSSDEIGELAAAFNRMTTNLAHITASRDELDKEIEEREQVEEALERSLEAERERARRDPLTGVLNHGAIAEELREQCSSAGESPVAVAMVDLDGLKAINDSYGHQAGDDALIIVANVLARDNAIVGRYGGDEFVVILPGANRAQAERYRDVVTAELLDARLPDPETDARIQIVVSWGLAVFPEEAETIVDLIHLSDSAMYAAKRQRPIAPDATATSRPLPGDRAATMVGQIVPLLTSCGDLTEKLQLVARRLAVGAGYDAVNFTLFSEATGQALTNTSYPHVPQEFVERWDRARQPDSESHPLTLLLAQTLRPLILDDPWNDERMWESERNVLRAAQLRSVLIAPMVWQDEMIGTIGVASKQLAAFGADDAQFLTAIATQVTAIVRMETLVNELRSATTQLSQTHEETVLLLAAAAEAHDHTTGLHLQSVRHLTEALARELGYAEADVIALGLASVLHDIGKIRVPDAILTSPAKLEASQWEIMKRHTIWGADFLEGHPGFELAATVALRHHEHWDGSGYPEGIAGPAIPEAATIVAVADAFDAITHNRPYRAGRSVDEAVAEIAAHSGTQFNPKAVAALEHLHQRNELPAVYPEVSATETAA